MYPLEISNLKKIAAVLLIATLCSIGCSPAAAQNAAQAAGSPSQNASAPAGLQPILAQIDQSAQQAAVDIAKLRIEKWKADSSSKQQAQANADSLQRNLSSALPAITSGVRAAPQALAPSFKLYRNLSALYDVLSGLTESAGAFGPQQDFDALKQQTEAFDGYRRSVGDYLETLTASKDSELRRLSQSQTQSVTTKPKKVIVDDDIPAPSKKKSKKKPAPTQ